jgi:hypothetical protein
VLQKSIPGQLLVVKADVGEYFAACVNDKWVRVLVMARVPNFASVSNMVFFMFVQSLVSFIDSDMNLFKSSECSLNTNCYSEV